MKRVQRKRTGGWKMPPNTVYVGRPTRWGNPYELRDEARRQEALLYYETWLQNRLKFEPRFLEPLRGKDLACWCPLEDKNGNPVPCHADILLKFVEATKQ